MSSFEKISFEKCDEIYYLGFGLNQNKSMTILNEETFRELDQAFDTVAGDKSAQGLVMFSHVKDCFLAGMDVSVIQGLSSVQEAIEGCEGVHEIFNKLEDLKCPTMALVDGICLGGGLEMILACNRIMASDNPKTSIGLPEVMLGILPGFGGTYRLPKKVGLPNSLDMILTGKQVKAKKALKIGLADFVVPRERMLELAPEYLKKKPETRSDFQSDLGSKALDTFLGRKIVFQKAREKVLSQTKGFYPAPLKILDHLEANYGKKRSTYLAAEAQAFGELAQTSQSKNLQNVFFLQDGAKKLDNKDSLSSVKRGGVVGAGVMGGGIAWLFAKNDQSPVMKDLNINGLELGLQQASQNFKSALKRRRMTQLDFERKMRSISPVMNNDEIKSVDLIVEAVVENMDVKKKVLKDIEESMRDDALLTTNTSSLSVSEMATSLTRSQNFAGLHFFNPVNKMPLVEIIRHPDVSAETIDRLRKWVLKVKKTPVVVGDGPGFLVNRILAPYLNEACFLLEEGVDIETLDKAALNFGMPMGPCRLMDEIGLDVGVHVAHVMQEGIGARMKASTLTHRAHEKDLLGKKNKRGFFLYDEKGKSTGVNPDAVKIIDAKRTSMEEANIQMRLILPMVNEAAYIIQDKIVEKAADVDLGMIFGTGFPPFRGGLLKYADSEGLDRLASVITEFDESGHFGERFRLAPLLKELAESGKKFYDL